MTLRWWAAAFFCTACFAADSDDVLARMEPRDAPLMPTLPPDQPLDTARVSAQFSSKALPPGK